MITSKQIISLSEEWLAFCTSALGDSCDIYINPGSSDFLELNKNVPSKSVRFFVDNKNKNFYVWDSNCLHGMAAKSISSEIYSRFNSSDINKQLLSGYGKLQGNKIVFEGSDVLRTYMDMAKIDKSRGNFDSEDIRYLKTIISADWSWSFKFIDLNKILTKIKIIVS